MRWFILLAFIGVLLIKSASSLKNHGYPSELEWMFGLNNKQNKNEKGKQNKPTVCQSQECKKIARIISESMDKSVDPCEDFYKYTCGNWAEHNPIPKGKDSWSMFENAQINVEKQIKEIFEDPKNDDLLAVKLAKKWYAVCMDLDAMERYGLEPLIFTLSRLGGWPLIMEPDEWNEHEYSWQKVDDQYMRLMGGNAFYDVTVSQHNYVNRTESIVHIDIPYPPPNSRRLERKTDNEEEEEDESDEDTSDEKDSQEPRSEDKNDNKRVNSNDDDENDNSDDDQDDSKDSVDDDSNEDDDDDDTNEESDDKNKAKKKVSLKKSKFKKNKKLGHSKKMNSIHLKKYKNHKTKKERVKRAIPKNVHKKLRLQKNRKNHLKQQRMKRLKKTLKATTSQISTKEKIDELEQYADYILKVACALAKARGVKVSKEHINKDIQDMIKFQKKLIKIIIERYDDHDDDDDDDYDDDNDSNDDDSDDDDDNDADDDSDNDDCDDDVVDDEKDKDEDEAMTLNDFQEYYEKRKHKTANSKIDWLYKIGELFDEAHVSIDDDLDIKINTPNYFKNLVTLLDQTSSRTIVNYIHWNFLSRIIQTTTSEMRKLYNAWEERDEDEEIFGNSGRSLKCVRNIELSNVVTYEYVRNHFSDEIITTASDMMDDIQKEIEYQIKESDWMNEDTKDFVLMKLVNMKKFIGYPDWYRNNTIVKRYLQGFIVGNSYYENMLSYDRYQKWKSLRKILKKYEDVESPYADPTTVEAFFDPNINSVAFSVADFQSPLFAYGRPQAINYGIIGSIMAHEVNHRFDNSGHLFENGNSVEWLSAMVEAYGKRTECFVKQFNNYPIDEASNFKIKDYGNQTAGENIADTMGLEAAFKAYRRRERECGKSDIALPGHEDLTNDQLFFISFANLWCAVTNNATRDAEFDVHSLNRLRVIGSVSNSQDFAEVYNCPVGSAMNPEKKCHIWK